ncbi:MAG: hypothetical protein GY938_29175 [Ketobacter sp.]|nr:hypothetical protein [Ketobacter sp.]
MMKAGDNKWRVKKYSNEYGVYYVLQKRFLGFFWWYNPDNFDGCITGVYNTLDEAMAEYKRKTAAVSVEIIEI